MDTSSAIGLIEGGIDKALPAQVWTDLGAGRGTFTNALAGLLDSKSIVYAVDKDQHALKQITRPSHGAKIITRVADFTGEDFYCLPSNGILMANALHYVEDQVAFLLKVRNKSLLPGGRVIVVEYNRDRPNPWIPFPVPFDRLNALALAAGFSTRVRIGEMPSVYDNGLMYSTLMM
ncbi:MAG TPA: methyltransferase domain-containing protein [Cyclobacteriaceae bacterium]|nr:methyltransferase domain-containing protein [Cyclobacteriaceae bacterium]